MAEREPAQFPHRRVLEQLSEGKRLLEYHKNRIIFAQGDPADAVFYIREGAGVSVTSGQPDAWRIPRRT